MPHIDTVRHLSLSLAHTRNCHQVNFSLCFYPLFSFRLLLFRHAILFDSVAKYSLNKSNVGHYREVAASLTKPTRFRLACVDWSRVQINACDLINHESGEGYKNCTKILLNPPFFEEYFLGLCQGGSCHIIGFDNPSKNYEKSMLNNDKIERWKVRPNPIRYNEDKCSASEKRDWKRKKERVRERARKKRTTLTHTHVVPVLSLDII